MSDFNSSLPTRTENPGDIQVKVVDSTTPSQQLAINGDGSVNITDNNNSLTIDTDDGPIDVQAVNLDIRDLVFATDKVDVSGSTNIGLDAATLAALETITVSNLPTTVDTNYGAVGASTIRTAAEIGNATGAANFNSGTTGAQTLRVSSNITRNGTELSYGVGASDANTIRTASIIQDGTDTLAINTDGSINVVQLEDTGTEIVNYNTASDIAAAATSNHDLVFASASKLFQVWASASGKLKITVQIETAAASGTFNTIVVGFNSTANPNIDLKLSKYAAIPAGARVRIIRQNNDNQAQDVYSTIVGILG